MKRVLKVCRRSNPAAAVVLLVVGAGFLIWPALVRARPETVELQVDEAYLEAGAPIVPGAIAGAPVADARALPADGPRARPGFVSVLVHMDPAVTRAAAQRADLQAFAAQRGGVVKYEYGAVLPGVFNLRDIPEAEVEALERLPGVIKVEKDEYHPNVLLLHDSTPLIRGLQSQITGAGYSADGAGVRICIVDTGIDSDHIMYSTRIDTSKGYDFFNDDSNPEDDHGHGSHCSGIAAGGTGISWDPCGTGSMPFQGVAPEATLIGVKVLNSAGGGYDSDIIAGIDYCADQSASGAQADVISMSIGTGNYSGPCTHSWAVAANNAVANGVVAVAASGNENNSNSMGSPACGVDVIAVGMTWKNDYPTCEDPTTNWNWGICTDYAPQTDDVGCFSNESDYLDVTAPGANIWSASIAAGGTSITGMSGTSMSCPHVAGLAALILDMDGSLTPAEVRQIIRDGAIDFGPTGFDRAYGYGRIDVINTLDELTPCTGDPDCDDGLWCNGAETCVAQSCQPGTDPCPGQSCDEVTDQCVAPPTVVYDWDMNTNPGWTTQGLWAWGQPTGGGGQYGGPDPTSGYTGSNVYGYNLNGDYENSLPETHLTTGAIDCSSLAEVSVRFRRWLGVEVSTYDHAYFRVSTNGTSWTTVWQNSAEVAETAWSLQEYDISSIADGQSTLYLRWTMGTTDGSWQYCGWNIDDVEILGRGGGPECTIPADCDDGLWCNGAEDCVGGSCVAGTAPNCNDGVACTDDSCNEGTDSCDNVANDSNCDNGLWCDGDEWCHATADCQAGTAVDCDDAVGCTDDSCNEGTDSCDNIPNDGLCDNGQWCDGDEWCHATADCQSGTAPDCDDGVGCTDDSCNEGTDSCDNIANNANCDNGLFCDGAETCHATLDCQAGSDPCPGQLCDEGTDTCYDCQVNADCSDGVYCNGEEQCVGGSCQAGTAVDCNDGVGCTDDSCNEGTDSCDNIANDANCADALYCNGDEWCDAVSDCQPGTTVDCNDAVGCTDDTCNEGTDSCDNIPNDAYCADGLYCNGAETCHATLDCQAGTAVDCNDGVGCTDDSCNETTDSCDNIANDANCPDDGLYCNGTEYCHATADCSSTGDPCTPLSCNETTDTCESVECTVPADCDDASDCTVDDCIDGVCYNDCTTEVSSFPYTEGFESGFGDWVNMTGDDMDWTRDSGGTPSSSTGPSSAHGGTYYVYTEASSPNYPDKTAILEGPCFDLANTSDASLTFWYHMYGSAMGTLNVEVSEDCITWDNVWSLSGNQGDAWYEADVDLSAYVGTTITIRFRGVTGSSYTSDMTVDDITVDVTPAQPCNSDPECDDGVFCNGAETCVGNLCQTGTDPCPGEACDEDTDTCFAAECAVDGDCDDLDDCTVDTCVDYVCYNECPTTVASFPYSEGFESGWGDWVNSAADGMDWSRNSGSTPSSNTGPSGAHGGTWYVYTEASSPNYPNVTGIIEGPCFDFTGASDAEMTFWYHMYGSAMGTLYLEASEDCASWTTVWSLGGNQGNAWYEANVDLSAYDGTRISLRFRGVTGSSYTSDMSVDDITITATVGPTCTVPADCDDGLYCNGVEDCVAGNCVAGTSVDCNDGVGCTDDSCNEGTDSCDNIANDANCADALYCNGDEWCDAVLDCQAGTAVDCDDGVDCTDDSCNEGTDSCDNTPNDTYCDNGLYCDGAETCNAVSDCQPGTAVDCDDGVGCTDDSCNEGTDSCDNIANDAYCPDNGLYCDGTEFCDEVADCSSTGDPCGAGETCDEDTDTCVATAMYTPAEYDHNEGMLIVWGSYNDVLTDMTVGVTTNDPDAIVYVVVTGAAQQSSADSTLSSAGADMSQVEYITYTTTTGWIRDYGPRFVINDDVREIVDFEYNRDRPSDNAFPAFLGGLWGETVSTMDLTHGGGNLQVAGGDAFMTDLVLDENPTLTEQDVADIIDQYLNLDLTLYGRFPATFDSTGHIDMWMLPVSDTAIIIGEYASLTGQPYTITENAVSDLTSRGYTVYRTPGWNTGGVHYTYTNGVIMNDVVLVPQFNVSEDATALSVIQTAFPDRICIQVDSTSVISAGGAGHCVMDHVPAVPCGTDADCADGLWCNGVETCVSGVCQEGSDPCPGQGCDEVNDECVSGPTAQLESGTVTVGGTAVTVNLTGTYVSPVVVCSVEYNNNGTPIVARVTGVTSTSFDVYLQNPSGGGVSAEDVSYLVVEEGVWTIDGVNIEGQAYLSTVTDENNSWVGEAQSYGQSYTNPVVVGQVMTDNDPMWSVFWCQGSSRTNPPSASALKTGKTVCEDSDTTRADETIGFIVFEAGHGTIGGVEFEAALGADTVLGVTNSPPYTYTFNSAFASAPTVAVTTMAGVDGGNGGWSYTYGANPTTATTLDLVIDEDQVGDSERNHTSEQIGYIVFSTSLVYP